ncbi:hypothetical protein LINPERPRIM_LOCUS41241 [Linum perenne]
MNPQHKGYNLLLDPLLRTPVSQAQTPPQSPTVALRGCPPLIPTSGFYPLSKIDKKLLPPKTRRNPSKQNLFKGAIS